VKEVRFDTRQPRQARTDFDGRFTIRGVADGKYTLTVDHTDGVADPIDDLEAGTEGLRVVLRATMSIRGVILDEDDLPVTAAQVNAIVPTAKGETKTGGTLGGSGRFQIDHLEPGSYAIEVSPSNQGWQATSGFETLRIPPVPAGSDNVIIRVSSGATVAGRVLSESGAPIAGAGVIALPKQLKPEERRNPYQTSRPAAITNGRGEFELKGVGSEPIEVIALAVGYQPGTEEVSPGGGAVTLRLEKGARIEGKVLLPDGKPLVGQWIWAQAAAGDLQNKFNGWQQRGGQTWNNFGGWQIFGTNTNSRGEFNLLSLLPGEYTLQINSAEGVAAEATYRTGSGDITIQLVSPLTIRGKVVDAAGNPIVPDGNYQVYINARRGSRYFSSATAAADGSFALKGLAPGKVTLNVWAGQRYKPATVDVEAGEQSLVISLEENKPAATAERR
jgi:protocatechuate 3,4-dioxygenase beta subunit